MLKKNPIIPLWGLVIFAYKLISNLLLNKYYYLAITSDSNFWNRSVYCYLDDILLMLYKSIYMVFIAMPIAYLMYEIMGGNRAKGWYKRAFKDCFWKYLIFILIINTLTSIVGAQYGDVLLIDNRVVFTIAVLAISFFANLGYLLTYIYTVPIIAEKNIKKALKKPFEFGFVYITITVVVFFTLVMSRQFIPTEGQIGEIILLCAAALGDILFFLFSTSYYLERKEGRIIFQLGKIRG